MHGIRLVVQPLQMLCLHLKRRAVTQGHPGAPVEFISYGIQLLLRVAAQIGALGEVLAQQPIGVLVASPLPRTVAHRSVKTYAPPRGWRLEGRKVSRADYIPESQLHLINKAHEIDLQLIGFGRDGDADFWRT